MVGGGDSGRDRHVVVRVVMEAEKVGTPVGAKFDVNIFGADTGNFPNHPRRNRIIDNSPWNIQAASRMVEHPAKSQRLGRQPHSCDKNQCGGEKQNLFHINAPLFLPENRKIRQEPDHYFGNLEFVN